VAQKPGNRKDEARERARVRREQQRKAERRRQLLTTGGVVLAVVIVVVAIVVVKITTGSSNKDVTAAAPASITQALAEVPAANFDSVGEGSSDGGIKAITGQTPLTSNGKPEVLYVGAEFCPYCAAERWGLVTALSRFGTFTGLDTTRSGADDGNYATLSFLNATYTSQYVSFVGKEIEDRAGKKLQTLTAQENTLASTLGPTKGEINFPFIDFGNKFVLSGSQYDPSILGKTSAVNIASQVSNPSTAIGKAVLGSANNTTAAICALTDQKPANVCTSAGVTAAAKTLNSGSTSGSSS
jgi:hypothetical protein